MTDLKNHIQKNIPKIFLLRFLREFWLIIPIIVPFYHSFGLTNMQILIIQAVFSVVMLLGEIPSGFFADVVGRKKALLVGAAFLPMGLCIYAFASQFWQFIVAEILLGIGFSMCSGSDSALLYDSLKQIKREKEYHRLEGRTESFGRIGSTIASIAGGLFALATLRMPFYINVITSVALFFVVITLVEPVRKKQETSAPLKDILNIVRMSLSHPRILSIILFMAAILSTGIIGLWGYLMTLADYKFPLLGFGIAFAVFQLTSALAAAASHKIKEKLGNRICGFALFIIPINFLLIGFVPHKTILMLALVNAFVWGFSTPFFLDMLNKEISSRTRATILSVASMMGRLGFVLLSPLFGFLGDKISLTAAFALLAFVFLSLFFLANRKSSIFD